MNPPARIGRYRVDDELGRGGFSRVYRAFDTSAGRLVAIKVLLERSKGALARFFNEASVAGNLRHKNIVTVYEFGEHEGQLYVVMEYLEGRDLQQIINTRTPLSLLEKCRIMWQMAEGLECAHRAGVVHGDVKPANIMVQNDGSVKIMDFGVARVTRDPGAAQPTHYGTLMYLAPEQFAGADIDALSDIFAYGVVYYELLTGRHPFEAPDSSSVMYKISFEDPPPIQNYFPDCTPALEAVISRVLSKDRELRYQSLAELQLDVEPILIELQRQKAAELVTQAQELLGKLQLDLAKTVVVEALGLDPSNAEARSLRERLQIQLQERTLRPRIETLLGAAEEHLGQRRFAEAIQSFESALRLGPDNADVQNRLKQAAALQEHSRAAVTLVKEARVEYDAQNLTAAYRSTSEALRHDPQNPEATNLLRAIEGALDRRRRDERIEDAVHRAEGHLLLRSFEEAGAVLAGLGEDAADSRAQSLIERIRKEKADHERLQRLQSEMAASAGLLRAGQVSDAAMRLEALRAEFPDSEEVISLLAYAQKGVEAENRARAVEQYTAKAAAFVGERNFAAALAILEEGLEKVPGEKGLLSLMHETMSAKSDWERQQAIERTLRECGRLRSEARFADALEMVDATLREHGAQPALAALRDQLQQEWAQQQGARRDEAVQAAAANVTRMLEEGRAEEAATLLRALTRRFPDEPQWAAVQAQVQEQMERQRTEPRRTAVQDAVRSAEELADQSRHEAALQLLDQALQRFPGEALLTELQQRLRLALEAKRRAEAVAAASVTARALLDRELYEEAAASLREASKLYPGEADLQSLMTEAEEERLASLGRRHAAPVLDHVHFTITAPSSLEPGGSFELYFWVHLSKQRRAVIDRAMLALGVRKPEEMVVKSEGPVPLPRGAVVSARISIDGLTVEPCEKSVLWSGETGCASFVIPVPPGAPQRRYPGIVSIRVNGCEIARMDFLLRVTGRSRRIPAKLKRHAAAFASYAAEDRDAVLARVQGMQKVAPWLKVFMDVVDLRSGGQWEREICQAIQGSDVFYLFWCSHARASEWVDREWRYAYQQRGLEFIDPVPLEPPHHAPPPDELKTKHFNDLWTELNTKSHRM